MATEFLYKIQPTRSDMLREGPTPAETAAIQAHFAYLQRAVEERIVLLAGRTLTTDAQSFGLVIFRADSEAEAERFMAEDPVVQSGVMRAELFPYRVALLSSTWTA